MEPAGAKGKGGGEGLSLFFFKPFSKIPNEREGNFPTKERAKGGRLVLFVLGGR